MFKIEIRSASNGTLTKQKIYQSEKSLNIWLPKMANKFCNIGNNITVFKYLDSGWESIPELFEESKI